MILLRHARHDKRHNKTTPYTAGLNPVSLNLLEIFGLLIGGRALFLLGLEFMTGGLKAIAGARLQALLGMLTASRFRGVLAGAAVTALLNFIDHHHGPDGRLRVRRVDDVDPIGADDHGRKYRLDDHRADHCF